MIRRVWHYWYWFKQGFKKELPLHKVDAETCGKLCASALIWASGVIYTTVILGAAVFAIYFMAML
jgi:hypothetical protein